ncbi:hypothetical protein GCM10023185_46080 [Hymenobacter saemangeumensis]|uniref:DUF4129 domain-containing protein n=1 Tax=Hymenobacter saemangeumensis TaxID=1084522 RepID=A0ABP8ISS1_9BACT
MRPSAATLRLIVLWSLSEALLGGVLHAFKLPLTGLLVGGASIVLIHVLGEEAARRGAVLRGLLVVLSIKALLSPQSPPTAYLAVAFQGVLGELLSWPRAAPRLRGMLLGGLTMLESAGQQVLVLWLLMGKSPAVAFNAFVDKLLGTSQADYALLLVGLWLGGHALAGLALGWWAGGLHQRLPTLAQLRPELLLPQPGPVAASLAEPPLPATAVPRRRRWRPGSVLMAAWALLALVWLGSQAGWWSAGPLGEKGLAGLLLRSALIYGAWALLLAPLLLRIIRRWLTGAQHGRWASDLEAALELLPATRRLVQACWQLTARHQGLARLRLMTQALALNTLLPVPAGPGPASAPLP